MHSFSRNLRLVRRDLLTLLRYVLLSLLVGLLLGLPAAAQEEEKDRVQLRQAGGSRIGIAGTILEYTGREIQILLNNDTEPVTYEFSEIVDVIYTHTRSHIAGEQAIAAGRYEEAIRLLEIGLAEEQRQWVRREILARQMHCEIQLGRYGTAGAKFLAIVESDPDTQYYKDMPLIWAPRQLTENDLILARQWIEKPRASAKLLGASFLLNDPTLQPTVLRLLKKLESHPDGRIFGLARAQSWRPVIQSGKLPAAQVSTWSRQVEETPEALRAGPYYLLGRAYLIRRDYKRAAQAFLWLPLVYDDDRELAARACLEAAHALALDGQAEQAQTLYREVAKRYADTPFAGEAKTALKQKN